MKFILLVLAIALGIILAHILEGPIIFLANYLPFGIGYLILYIFNFFLKLFILPILVMQVYWVHILLVVFVVVVLFKSILFFGTKINTYFKK